MPYKNIVVLTGAGISQESGLKTFRDADGLWEGHAVSKVATFEAFKKDPELVHEFYNQRRAQLKEIQPNLAHEALASFEQTFSGSFTLITQNVDDLHARAGSKNIIHMHGELRKARNLKTGEVLDWKEDLSVGMGLRPHICWFGEVPFHLFEIEQAISKADLFVAIGTSGTVYPAANLVRSVPANCYKVLINKEEASNNPYFDEVRLGLASEVVPEFFKKA